MKHFLSILGALFAALLFSTSSFAGTPQTVDRTGAQVAGEATFVPALAVVQSDGSQELFVPANLAKGRSFANATVINMPKSAVFRNHKAIAWAENRFGGSFSAASFADTGPDMKDDD